MLGKLLKHSGNEDQHCKGYLKSQFEARQTQRIGDGKDTVRMIATDCYRRNELGI